MARGLVTLGTIITLVYAASSQDAASLGTAVGTAVVLTIGLAFALHKRGHG